MTILLCQPDLVWENKPANFAKVRELLSDRAPAGSLIVLPEMFATGFSMETATTSEPVGGPTEEFLRTLGREMNVWVIGGLIADDGSGPRNQALAVDPDGKVRARYTKQRPFSLEAEGSQYAGGHEAVVFDGGGFRIALFVCYDLRFPELFRTAAAQGATLFVVIANWPARRQPHWLTLLQARAIENQACVIGVNRCGSDPRFSYSGRSIAVDPMGVIIADAGEREGVVSTGLDPAWVSEWRREFPALRDAGIAG